jgi:hypothetical protein
MNDDPQHARLIDRREFMAVAGGAATASLKPGFDPGSSRRWTEAYHGTAGHFGVTGGGEEQPPGRA